VRQAAHACTGVDCQQNLTGSVSVYQEVYKWLYWVLQKLTKV
jgi:hypothetical protein